MHPFNYCDNLTVYSRLHTNTVTIGDIPIGSNYPIRLQSMTNTNTLDTMATVEQCIRMIKAGCDYVRITTPSIKEAENLLNIKKSLKLKGYKTPLIADVHFNPRVAEVAAQIVEKVRINPGNYIDKKNIGKLDFTETEYANEIERIHKRIKPLIQICKEHGTALRIGSNHGSLSDRILSRYGNTPLGMVEAAMEFLRICNNLDFKNIVVSMKSSNTRIMVQSTRLLVHKMLEEKMCYPLHLGVTEAGEGEDGRIKSAVGIGTLLEDGIGDTIRVSLSEAPELELPIAKTLIDRYSKRVTHMPIPEMKKYYINPFSYQKRQSKAIASIGGDNIVVISSEIEKLKQTLSLSTQTINTYSEINSIDFNTPIILKTSNQHGMAEQRFIINSLIQRRRNNPIIINRTYKNISKEEITLYASTDLGALLIDGLCDGIQIESLELNKAEIRQLELSILQATGTRISQTEFISCPTCGRTQFDLPKAISEIKERTSHLKGLKIAVMGCIVNGPGEMADADYGYVGSGKGKVTLFRKQHAILKNIPEDKAIEELILLIKRNNDWVEPIN